MTSLDRTSYRISITVAYRIGSLSLLCQLLSPLQQLPSLGPNPVYIVTLADFVTPPHHQQPRPHRTLCQSSTYSRRRIYRRHLHKVVPYAMCHILHPIIVSFPAQAVTWHRPLRELAWISGFTYIFLFFLPLHETFGDTICRPCAQPLRSLTGHPT